MSVLFDTTTVPKYQATIQHRLPEEGQGYDQKSSRFSEALLTDVSELLTYITVLSLKYAFYQCRLSYIHIQF